MRVWKMAMPVALALALVATAGTASAQRRRGNDNAAAAPATGVVVLNFQRVLAESTAGRAISASLQQIGGQINGEMQALQPEGAAIRAEQERLTTATRTQTAEQRRTNPQIIEWNRRAQAYQARTEQLQADMECTSGIALREFERQVTPAVQAVMSERRAGVVLDSRSVQLTAPELDVTNDVLQRVNSTVPSIPVARQSYTACQATPTAPAPSAPNVGAPPPATP